MPEEAPRRSGCLEVSSDGSRVYLSHQDHYVLDATGRVFDIFRVHERSYANGLFPIKSGEQTGWFIACHRHFGAHLGLVRPDGTEAKTLVKVTQQDTGLYSGWGRRSPMSAAVDFT